MGRPFLVLVLIHLKGTEDIDTIHLFDTVYVS